ncbi:Metal-nicotianamine transporter YSL3 [Trichinella spiralis]|uniref:Metal-nicotianamine transporter YSL3 n=1 Tax=Trichinella spiralis TaxID=6334 RepID=A0ABR3KZB2_TRISP
MSESRIADPTQLQSVGEGEREREREIFDNLCLWDKVKTFGDRKSVPPWKMVGVDYAGDTDLISPIKGRGKIPLRDWTKLERGRCRIGNVTLAVTGTAKHHFLCLFGCFLFVRHHWRRRDQPIQISAAVWPSANLAVLAIGALVWREVGVRALSTSSGAFDRPFGSLPTAGAVESRARSLAPSAPPSSRSESFTLSVTNCDRQAAVTVIATHSASQSAIQ